MRKVTMRIAFDVDETLIPYNDEFPVEHSLPSPLLRLWFKEELRQGTIALLKELRRQGHDLWIYTTSGRTDTYFRIWFLLLGIRLGGVVNCHVHEKRQRRSGHDFPNCSKYPPAFGIDLLIDNSDGVVLEGRQNGFDVLLILPDDANWTEHILEAVQARYRLVRQER